MQEIISPQALSELIASIYDCALDPEHWGETLGDLRVAFGGGSATLTLMDRRRGRAVVSKYAGLNLQELEAENGPEVARMLADFLSAFEPDEPQVFSRFPPGY